jgi:tetratricopeptide (TPR) repeat protein
MPRVRFFKDRRFAQDRIRFAKILLLGAALIAGVAVSFYYRDRILSFGGNPSGAGDRPKSKNHGDQTVRARPSALWDQPPRRAMGALGAKAVRREALSENARIMRSSGMVEAEEPAKALPAAETAATVGPNASAAWQQAGSDAMARGENDEARRCFHKALEIAPFALPTRQGSSVENSIAL